VIAPSRGDIATPQQEGDGRSADGGSSKAMPFDGKRMFWGGFKEIVGL
jgi:uncharacterized protein YbaA (DUF1428 family)